MMKKILVSTFFLLVTMFGGSATAQVVYGGGPGQCQPAPTVMGQPQRCYDGRFITQPVYNQQQPVYNGGYAGYGDWNGQQVPIPQGISIGQQFGAVVGGRSMRCTLADRAATGVVGGILGYAIGYAIDHHEGNRDHHNARNIGVGGLVAGATLLCQPDMVDDTPAPQMRVAYQPQPGYQQGGYQQPVYRGQPQSVTVPSSCIIDGDEWEGLSREQCKKLAKKLTVTEKVSASEKVSMNTIETKTETVGECSNICVRGKSAARLNWPGHPQNGTCVCIPDGEANNGARTK